MRVSGLPAGGPSGTRPVLAIGVFDGVHLGHQSLLSAGLGLARRLGAPLWVLTFWPHPEEVLRRQGGGREAPGGFLLSTLPEKVRLMRLAGAERVLVLRFTAEAAAVGPEDFFRHVLVSGVRPGALVVGFNFTFGRAGRGNPGLLGALARAEGVEMLVHPAVRVAGEPVSSSAVRGALATGDVEKAAGLLGRQYSLAGPVEKGAGRGRGLGFPTANVALPPGQAIPAPGVYFCSVLPSGEAVPRLPAGGGFPAMANLGRAPTFAESDAAAPLRLEAHVLEDPPPAYGDVVRVFFQRWLRPERRFGGRDDLVAQLRRDQAAARAYFGLAPGRSGPAET